MVLVGFILVVAGAIAFTTYQFNTYKPREISQEVVPDNLKYFQETYNDCRKKFYEQAEGIRQQYKDVSLDNLGVLVIHGINGYRDLNRFLNQKEKVNLTSLGKVCFPT